MPSTTNIRGTVSGEQGGPGGVGISFCHEEARRSVDFKEEGRKEEDASADVVQLPYAQYDVQHCRHVAVP
jgi:hypothetical protein